VDDVELQLFEPRVDGVGRPLPGNAFRVLATHRRTGAMALRHGDTQLIAIQRACRAVRRYASEDAEDERSAG